MLTNQAINSIVAALPNGVQPRKAALLGRILREWAQVELQRHRTYGKDSTQTEREHLGRLRTLALELTTTLNSLSERERILLALMAARQTPQKDFDQALQETSRQLISIRDAGSEIAEVAGAAVVALTRGRGRPRAITQYLIMKDLAAMFEFATGRAATRSVRGEDHPEHGKEYGDFWNFARAIWIAVFKSEKGLSSAVRNWAEWHQKERSALIANIDLRHPEWGIFRARR